MTASLQPSVLPSAIIPKPARVSSVDIPAKAIGERTFKWRMVVAYDGTNYAGFQYQETTPTIQWFVEKALIRFTKLERKSLCLTGAGRTDAGVHAWGQVAHFTTPSNYDSLQSMHEALNGLLPPDIRIREISPAINDFHARFSVKGKTYRYTIYNDEVLNPFQRLYAYHSTHKLNAEVMKEAAKLFVGTHDFTAFANCSRDDKIRNPNPVKTIFRCEVLEMGTMIHIDVEGSGFLYRQVRNMVALLIEVGKEALPPDIVAEILPRVDRRELAKAALSAPPHGLCLLQVNYKEEHLVLPPDCPAISVGRYHTITKCKLPFY